MLYLTDQKRRKKVKCIVLVYIHFQDGQFSPSKGISNEIYILFSARKASCFPIFTIKTQLGNPNRLPAVNWISRITKRVVIGSTHCTMLWPFQIKTLVQSLIMPLQLQVFYHLKHKRTRFTRLHPHTHTHTHFFLFLPASSCLKQIFMRLEHKDGFWFLENYADSEAELLYPRQTWIWMFSIKMYSRMLLVVKAVVCTHKTIDCSYKGWKSPILKLQTFINHFVRLWYAYTNCFKLHVLLKSQTYSGRFTKAGAFGVWCSCAS